MKKALPVMASILVAIVTLAGMISYMAQSSVAEAAASTVKLYVNPPTASMELGKTESVQLKLSKNSSAKVDYVDARLTFSTANLEVISISKQGSHFSYSGGPVVSYNNSNGTIVISGSGAELPTSADVLIATITFKGKSVGTGSVSFTSASQAGDMTNGGHVKDALTARVGGVVTVTHPPASNSTGGGTGGGPAPSSPVPPTTTNGENGEGTKPAPDSTSDKSPAASTDGQGEGASTTAVAETLEQAVTKPPVWLQFLVPGAAVIAALGIGGLGWALYQKHRRSGVSLPKGTEEAESSSMPSTEQDSGLGIPIVAATDEVSNEGNSIQPQAELPEFSAAHPELSTLTTPPMPPEVPPFPVVQSPELMPQELAVVPSVTPSAIEEFQESSATEPTEAQEVQASDITAPVPATVPVPNKPPLEPEPVVVEQAIAPPTRVEQSAPSLEPLLPTTPEPLPLPPEPSIPTATETPESSLVEAVSTTPQVTVAQQTSSSTPQPVSVPVSSPAIPAGQTTAAAQLSQADNVDYANMPDMFDEGNQRLQNEGLNDLRPAQQ